ncbi:hypothetical protein D0O09_29925 [Pseudomonas putida]|nr:hypothetical protein D0O09_29925 [Pseudomonas putida]
MPESCTGPFAGKPAPTETTQALRSAGSCGSGFTREEAGTAFKRLSDQHPTQGTYQLRQLRRLPAQAHH